jgi:amino acid transporter
MRLLRKELEVAPMTRTMFLAIRSVLATLGIFQVLSIVLSIVNNIMPLPGWLIFLIFVPLTGLFYSQERKYRDDA